LHEGDGQFPNDNDGFRSFCRETAANWSAVRLCNSIPFHCAPVKLTWATISLSYIGITRRRFFNSDLHESRISDETLSFLDLSTCAFTKDHVSVTGDATIQNVLCESREWCDQMNAAVIRESSLAGIMKLNFASQRVAILDGGSKNTSFGRNILSRSFPHNTLKNSNSVLSQQSKTKPLLVLLCFILTFWADSDLNDRHIGQDDRAKPP
jgi:hypothetical protein